MHDHGNDSGRNHPFNCSSGDRSTSHCLVSARSWTREILLHSSVFSLAVDWIVYNVCTYQGSLDLLGALHKGIGDDGMEGNGALIVATSREINYPVELI